VTVEILKENTGVAEKIEKSLTLFVEAVELSSDLEFGSDWHSIAFK